MIVSIVSVPEGIVARTHVSEARERLAASSFLLVDIELARRRRPVNGRSPTNSAWSPGI
jgi:magnesium transporter